MATASCVISTGFQFSNPETIMEKLEPGIWYVSNKSNFISLVIRRRFLQCFDTVGWMTERV